jgi:hypothetical protein
VTNVAHSSLLCPESATCRTLRETYDVSRLIPRQRYNRYDTNSITPARKSVPLYVRCVEK